MKWVLLGKDGIFADAEFKIEQTLTLGRAEHNDVVIQNDYVSRNHARLSIQAGELYLDDLNSTSGIRVNGQKVGQAKLAHDDLIQIEDVVFQVQDESRVVDLGQTLVRAPEDAMATIVRPPESPQVSGEPLAEMKPASIENKSEELVTAESLNQPEEVGKPVLPEDSIDPTPESPVQEAEDNATVVMPAQKEEIPNKTMQWTPSQVSEGGTIVMKRDDIQAAAAGEQPSVEQVILRGLSDPIKDKDFSLSRNKITIGRSTLNHISVQSTVLSANHAELVKEGEDWIIHDLSSANGTFVNGKQVLSMEHTGGSIIKLQPNDHIKLGNVEMVFNPSSTGTNHNVPPIKNAAARKKGRTVHLENIGIPASSKSRLLVICIAVLAVLVVVLAGLLIFSGSGSDGASKPSESSQSVKNLTAASQWRVAVGQAGVYSDIAIANVNGDSQEEAVVLDQQGRMHVFSTTDGGGRYSTGATEAHSQPPLIAQLDGDNEFEIITVSESGVVRAYDGNAQLMWQQGLAAGSVFTPALVTSQSANAKLIVPTERKGYVALDLSNQGRELWNTQHRNQRGLTTTPLMIGQNTDAIFGLSFDGKASVLKSRGTEVVWEASLPGRYVASPVLTSIDGRTHIVTANLDGLISAIDGDSGAIFWQQQLAGAEGVIARPIITTTGVMVADISGQLYVLDLNNGSQVKTMRVASSASLSGLLAAPYELFAAKSTDNSLVLFNGDAEQVATVSLSGSMRSGSAPALMTRKKYAQLISIDDQGYANSFKLEQ